MQATVTRNAPLRAPECVYFRRYGASFRFQRSRIAVVVNAEGESASALGKFITKLQASLPVVGLISNLTSPSGLGIEKYTYTEYTRAVSDAAPPGFQIATSMIERQFGKSAQRRNVLFCLWMARLGGGLVPEEVIYGAATRLPISLDIEYEMERFNQALGKALEPYRYQQPPEADHLAQCTIALTAVLTLCKSARNLAGRRENGGDKVELDNQVTEDLLAGAFWDIPSSRETAKLSIISMK